MNLSANKAVKMPNIREFELWLTTGDAASRLGKSRQGVVWMLENRRLRGVRTALGWLVDPASVEEMASRRQGERGEAGKENHG